MLQLREIALACLVISIAYYTAVAVAGLMFARRSRRAMAPLPKVPPKVAVLKPLHGLGANLPDNLVTFLESSYPRADFLFGVCGYEDRAAEVPVVLRGRYQFRNITLVVGEEPGCTNKKVAKLIKMAERAPKADIYIVSDADVSISPDHIRRVVGELMADEKIGVVTCAYRARPSGTLASRLEALVINTGFLPMVLLSASIEPMRHAFGAMIAIKRSALESMGGFAALKDVLADDFFLGRWSARAGWRVKLSNSLVTVTCEERTFVDFWRHQLRWARTYRTTRPMSIGTIVTHGQLWALVLFFSSLGTSFAFPAFCILAATFGVRLGLSAMMIRKVAKLPELVGDIALMPIKDALVTAIWFASLLSNKVVWAGREFKIRRGGFMRELSA